MIIVKDGRGAMIFGTHVIVESTDAEADRAFIAQVFGFPSVDVGHGWLLFALPPAEVAVHPAPAEPLGVALYFMCDDLPAEISGLEARGVGCSPIETARWGTVTRIALPGGGHIGLYQPSHPTALPPTP